MPEVLTQVDEGYSLERHWTTRSLEDLRFSVGADFLLQLDKAMSTLGVSRSALAESLGLTRSAISQLLSEQQNNNFTLDTLLRLSAAVGLKPAIVLYATPKEDGAPVCAEVFARCWEDLGRPEDFWPWHEVDRS